MKKNPLEYCALHIKAIINKNHLFVDVHIALNVMFYQYLYDNDEKVNNNCGADNLFSLFCLFYVRLGAGSDGSFGFEDMICMCK